MRGLGDRTLHIEVEHRFRAKRTFLGQTLSTRSFFPSRTIAYGAEAHKVNIGEQPFNASSVLFCAIL